MTSQTVDIGDLSRTAVRYREEATFNVDPGSVTYTDIAYRTDSLGLNKPNTRSENVNSTRRTKSHIFTDLNAAGDITADLMLGQFDDWFEAVAGGTYVSSTDETGITITVAASGTSTTWTRASGDWTTNFSVGDWVRETAALNAANQVVKKVSAVSATVLTLEGGAASAQSSIAGCAVHRFQQTPDADAFRSYALQKDWTQWSNRYVDMGGMVVNTMAMTAGARGKPSITWGFAGASEDRTTSEAGDGSPTAALSNRILSLASGVKLFMEGGAGPNRLVDWSCNISYGIYPIPQGGTQGPVAMGKGPKAASGRFETYVEAAAGLEILDHFHDETPRAVALALADVHGNYLILDFPKIIYTNVRAPFVGDGRPSIVTVEWEAEEATEGGANLLYRTALLTN